MEAKEKAISLYNSVKYYVEFNSQPSTVHDMCKNLATFCVEQIKQSNYNPNSKLANELIDSYWNRVLTEISKL